MRGSALLSGLRFKIAVGLIIPLLGVSAVLSYPEYVSHRQLMMENLKLTASNVGKIIESGLHHAMLTNDFAAVQQIVDDIAEQQGVDGLFLLDRQGQVVISTERSMIGAMIELSDPTCQACHRYKVPSRNDSAVLVTQQGAKVFRNVNTIENEEICHSCHNPRDSITGVLITDFSTADIDRHLAADLQSNLLWSAGSIILVLVIANLMMSRMVISRLGQLVSTMKRVGRGDLSHRAAIKGSDEIGQLAYSFNQMTEELQAHSERLSALNTMAATVSRSLDMEEVMHDALDEVLELTRLEIGWIALQGGQDNELHLAAYRGLPDEMMWQHVQDSAGRCICPDMLVPTEAKVIETAPTGTCPMIDYAWEQGLLLTICVPIRSKERVLGIMCLIGDDPGRGEDPSRYAMVTLTAIGQQIGMAIENASLYEELRQKEMLLRQLLDRMISTQEEERRRIARELHDETSQALTSLMVQLKVLEEADSLRVAHMHLSDMRAAVAKTLEEVHSLALELRPSTLDDLGLLAALQNYLRHYEHRFGLAVDFQVLGIGSQRLLPQVETTLYRIVQEALTNVVRHAQARTVSVLLERRGSSVVAIVEDDGRGFDVASIWGSHPQEQNLGLYGMQERASLLGGTMTIESTPGVGTAVYVEIPLEVSEHNHEEDPFVTG